MKEVIAYCGLACHECGAYLSTINDDDEKRKEVAELWSKEYNANFKPSDVDCLGCLLPNERLFSYCVKCAIRSCAIEKGVANCAHCSCYDCEKLAGILDAVPAAKKRLDEMRAGR